MIKGSGVSSRSRARAGIYGRKEAANGFSGFAPTISGYSFAGSMLSLDISLGDLRQIL